MTEARQRTTAFKVPIKILKEGSYVKEEGEFAPNYIDSGSKRISRANIIGIVLSIDNSQNIPSFTIDDGSDNISIRGFEPTKGIENIHIGDIVMIIGRPREYGSERYLLPEIIRKTDQRWMIVRKRELGGFEFNKKKEEQDQAVEVEIVESGEVISKSDQILEYIRKNESGDGVEIEELIKGMKFDNVDKQIEGMLKEGDLFENLPGRIKILE